MAREKTTLLRVLLGLVMPQRGRCRVGGISPSTYRRKFGVGYLPERLVFPRAWTAADVLKRGVDLAVPSRSRRSAYALAIERSGMASTALAQRADRCSAGTQKRLGIAFALIGDPDVVILDEPFANLDPMARQALRTYLHEARSRGAAVLFASHNLHEVADNADSVIVIKTGETRLSERGRETADELAAGLLSEA